jgi:hypothetical protein
VRRCDALCLGGVNGSMSERGRYLTSTIAGGAAASLVMDLTQTLWAQAFERRRDAADLDEETEAIASVVRILIRSVPSIFRERDAVLLGHGLHYMLGIAFAGAYLAAVPASFLPTRAARGATFGVALWMLSDRILIPLLKLGRPWSRYSVAERTNALASHVAYGLVVEAARPR